MLAVHLFGRPLDWEGLEAAAPGGGRWSRTPPARSAPATADRPCGSLGVDGLPLLPPAQDRHDRRGRRGDDRRRRASPTRCGGCATTGSSRAATSTSRSRVSTTGSPDVLCALGIPQLERLDELLDVRERVAAGYAERLAGVVELPEAAPGDRHGWQAYVVGIDRRDEALACAAGGGDRGADRHLRAAPADGLSRPGRRSRAPTAAFERALALPFHIGAHRDSELDRVAEALARFAVTGPQARPCRWRAGAGENRAAPTLCRLALDKSSL